MRTADHLSTHVCRAGASRVLSCSPALMAGALEGVARGPVRHLLPRWRSTPEWPLSRARIAPALSTATMSSTGRQIAQWRGRRFRRSASITGPRGLPLPNGSTGLRGASGSRSAQRMPGAAVGYGPKLLHGDLPSAQARASRATRYFRLVTSRTPARRHPAFAV
jgi:hypothetical protein